MSLRMPGPWKHPETGVYYLRQRRPSDLRTATVSATAAISVAGEIYIVKTGSTMKVSLRTKDPADAKVRYREADASLQAFWRAQRGGPEPLSNKDIHALAGVLYRELIDLMDAEPGEEGIWSAVMDLNQRVLDAGKLNEWFGPSVDHLLAKKGINTDALSRTRVVHAAFKAIQQAAEVNQRKAQGDYSPDARAERFPALTRISPEPKPATAGESAKFDLFALLDHKFATQSLKPGTKANYQSDLKKFVALVGHSDARLVTKDNVRNWRDALIAEGLSPSKINGKCLAALSAVLTHGVKEFGLSANLAQGIRDARRGAPPSGSKGYSAEQAKAILEATFSPPSKSLSVPHQRALFWVPWICAYTGLRVSEITQLRGERVLEDEGVPHFLITPADGGTKSDKAWLTAIHPHLVELGLLEMFRAIGSGPAFYVPYPEGTDLRTVSSKPRSKDAGNRVSNWVTKELRISAPGGKPNHAWRHLFTTLSRQYAMDKQARDYMLGSGRIDAREGYGDWPPSALAREIGKLPSFEVKEGQYRPPLDRVASQPLRAPRGSR